MKQHICRKIISLAAAAMLSCPALPADCIRQMTASAQEPPALSAVPGDAEPIRVVVRLKSPALIELFDKEALGTDAAAAEAASITAQQEHVQAQIREFYPELAVGADYHVLMNGFACSLPESLFDNVCSLPDVASVDVLPEIEVPQMSNAAALSGMPAFMEKTGCTGEGQVICVIDTELYTDHPMFAALPDTVDTRLSKEDVTGIIQSGTLHKTVDPDKAYLSSKIPYAVDYVDQDLYGGVTDEECYHGTHVSGIAAGNTFVSGEGRTVSGMAPDAQLIFMAVNTGYRIDDEAALQALEDAVTLHADVINMSWGGLIENYNGNLFAEVLDAADRAGITVCTSAGNSDNGTSSLLRSNYPESPDIGTIDHKVEPGNSAFVVASADNNTTYQQGVLRFEGEDIPYLPAVSENGKPYFLTDMLPVGKYEFVDYGDFSASDLESLPTGDFAGKLMLVQHSTVEAFAVAMGAKQRGAAGVLLVDDAAYQGGSNAVFCNETEMPIAFISSEICKRLQNAENKVIENPGSKIERTAESKISFYSSWGTGHALDLRPDITGIGGSVESANYNGGTEIMSGTSMSSPYVAGAAAVVRQYLKQQGIEASGSELTRYVRRLMMNSAVPFEADGLLVTPRQQGAGLVSLDRLVRTKVILTGDEGDAKVNLYDKLGDTFSFDVTLTNLGSEDVTFSDARLRLTTDDTDVSEKTGLTVISGQRALDCTAELSGLTSVKAGKTRTVTVQVSLDPSQTAAISRVFKNGFFIDGFLLLSGAENSADISVPVCGYYGDWSQIPICSTDWKAVISTADGSLSWLSLPLNEALPILDTILARASQEEIDEALNNNMLGWLIQKYWTKEEDALLERGHGDAWISPNGDGMHDEIDRFSFELKRQAKVRYTIQNADGNRLFEAEKAVYPPMNEKGGYIFDKPLLTLPIRNLDFSELPEGDYKISTDMWINYPDAENHPQNLEIPFKVDTTAPEMHCTIEQEGDRTYLQISARDNGELDCVFLTAKCADDSRRQTGITMLNKLDLFSIYAGGHPEGSGIDRTEPLPYVLTRMVPKGSPTELIYDYSEMFPAEQDGSGTVEVRYDITGLTDVTVTALDRAWNYAVFDAIKGGETVLKNGLWIDEGNGFMEISGNTIRFADFYDGSIKQYTYTIRDDIMTMTSPEETIVRHLYFKDPEHIEYPQDESDMLGKMRYSNYDKLTTLDDISFHPFTEAYPLLREYFEKNTGLHVTGYTYTETTPFELFVEFETQEEVEEFDRAIGVNLFTGIGDYMGNKFDLFSAESTFIEPGIYQGEGLDFFMVFNEDHQTGKILVVRTDKFNHLNEFGERDFTYESQGGGRIGFRFADSGLEGYASLTNTGQVTLFLGYQVYRLQRKDYDLSLAENFHSLSQAEAIVSRYHEAVTGKPAEYIGGGTTMDGELVIAYEGEFLYCIDPFTLEGHDMQERVIDYANPPVLPDNAKSLDTLTEWALKDYSDKTGRTDGDARARLTTDGTVEVSIFQPASAYDAEQDEFMNAVYTVDPVTATGFDQDQNPIDLPKTGSNDPGAAAAAGLAMLLTLGGAGICWIAEKRRKKR